MLVAAATLPATPLLDPAVMGTAAGQLDDLRTACAAAVAAVLGAAPETVVVVGAGTRTREHAAAARGTLAGLGASTAIPADVELMAVSLVVATALLADAGRPPDRIVEVASTLSPTRCRHLGVALAAGPARIAMVVAADGTATRTARGPFGLDDRSAGWDAAAAHALATADLDALDAMDAGLADTLHASGRAPWQVMTVAAAGAGLTGVLLHDSAPLGVAYLVATWT